VKVHFFETPEEWRAWLEANHASASEVEVGFRRRSSGLPSMTWSESVDEALCFGWIDGVRRKVDEMSYRIRFTPRKPRSAWSKVNLAKYDALVAAGKVHAAGRAAFERGRPSAYSFERDEPAQLEPEMEARLRADAAAWGDWSARPPGYRRTVAHWVMSAKRPETRQRRLALLIECSAQGRTVPPLTRPGG
jgi:uncharacterized protein YdeI (YjbR/CyaY-like superfamily)